MHRFATALRPAHAALAAFLMLISPGGGSEAYADTCTSTGSGYWDDPIWSCSAGGDMHVISAGHTVHVNQGGFANFRPINGIEVEGTLQLTGGYIKVLGTFLVVGRLERRGGGVHPDGTAPSYQAGSTLVYDDPTSSTSGMGHEWTYEPYHVEVYDGLTLSSPRTAGGDVTFVVPVTLRLEDQGRLEVDGTVSWPQGGTLVFNPTSGNDPFVFDPLADGHDYWPASDPLNVDVYGNGLDMRADRSGLSMRLREGLLYNAEHLAFPDGKGLYLQGGSIASGQPTYKEGSFLRYEHVSTLPTLPGLEWSKPHDVILAGNTSLNLDTGEGDITIGGDLDVQSGATLRMGTTDDDLLVSGFVKLNGTIRLSTGAGMLKVGGDWRNFGGTLERNGNTVELNGSALQTIDGSTTSLFDGLVINNPNGVRCSQDVRVFSQLELVQGSMMLNGGDLRIEVGGRITGVSSGRYIITSSGTLAQQVDGTDTLFPVGTATSYAPVTLSNTGTTDHFLVRADEVLNHAPLDPNRVVNLEWHIEEGTAGGSDVTVTLQWNESNEAASFDREGAVFIGRYDDAVSAWEETPATVSGTGPFTATAGEFSTFSPFGIGNAGVLPVELIAFDALVDGSDVRLRWKTASETNNAGFEIQRSRFAPANLEKGKVAWESVGFVEGHGTTLKAKTYQFDVVGLEPGRHTFRLKQIDYDGTFDYSPEVEVIIALPEAHVLTAPYPNPFIEQAQFSLMVKRRQQVEVMVCDALGRRVRELYRGMLEAEQARTFVVDADGLPAGLYIIRVEGAHLTAARGVMRVR